MVCQVFKEFKFWGFHLQICSLVQFARFYDITTSFTFIIWFGVHIQPFFNLKNFVKTRTWSNFFAVCRLLFQIHQKIEPWYFGFAGQIYHSWKLHVPPGQSTIKGDVRFPTTQFGIDSNLLYIEHSNLKNLNRKIKDTNPKKIGYPNFLPG